MGILKIKAMNPRQLNYTQQLEHRLKMVEDDLSILKRFIEEQGLEMVFKNICSATSDNAYCNISNIEIACDLNDPECLSWGMFY